MNCPRCNNEYADNYTHCPACGTQNPTYQQQQTPVTNQPAPLPRPPYPTAVELIKKIGQSKLFLVVAILYSVCTAISALSSNFDIMAIIRVVAIWMFFSESKKDGNPYEMNTSSFKTLRILKTIEIVIMSVAIGLVTILMLFASILMMATGEAFANTLAIVFIVFILVFAAIGALSIFLSIGIRSYYKGAIQAIETGTRPEKLSSFAPIWMIVTGILSIITDIALIVVTAVFGNYFVNDLFGSYLDQLSPYLDEAASFGLSYSFSTLSGSIYMIIITGIVGSVCNILIGKLFLDAKKLAAESYFPSAEEYIYFKREFYAYKMAAEEEARARYQAQYRASYQQYQQNNYAQQQYQAPYGQPNGQQYQAPYGQQNSQQYQAPNGQQNGQQYQAPYGQQNGQQNNNNPW